MRQTTLLRRTLATCAIAATAVLVTCRRDSPTAVSDAPAVAPPGVGAPFAATVIDPALPILVGAGDIGCSSTGPDATSAMLDTISGTVFTAGDNVTSSTATAADYTNCYDPGWGRQRARTRPAVGDIDYKTAGAGAYYTYFGKAAAGDSAKYYYSYDVGTWHVIVLNSETSMSAGSAQDVWLKADLVAHPASCTVAIWHQPRFYSSGTRSASLPAWNALYAAGVELILNGHQRNYERFAPMTPSGGSNPTYGIRQIIVGTGGAAHGSFGSTASNSLVRDKTAYGLLKVTLGDGSYDWTFIPTAPATFTDAGSAVCHGPPPPVASAGGPYTSEAVVAFDGSKSSDAGGKTLTYSWDFGDGSAPGTGVKPSHSYAVGTYTATLVVTNSAGASSAPSTAAVTIKNFPPTVNAGPDAWIPPASTFTLRGSFTDPGNDGPFAYSVDWGDGSAVTTGTVAAVGALAPTHVYNTSARFAATLTVTDVQGASGTDRADILTNQPSASAQIFIGAGDIASCGSSPGIGSRADKTAKLLDAEVAINPGAQVFTIGDNVYQDMTIAETMNCYDPTWGRHNARVHPTTGNHEYNLAGAYGYWQYFTYYAKPAVFVGDSGKYWYSYDVGTWHIIVLNDNINTDTGSEQEKWLVADLAAHPAKCTIAMWHKPRVNQEGVRNGYTSMWTPLYNAGAEIVLSGHVHRYERYAEQTPALVAAPGRGIRELIVGTGGAGVGSSTKTPANLEIANGSTWGVLKLWLDTDGYYWKFIPIEGQTFTDMGYTACH